MIINETTVRVRYGDTDQMGYVYYGKYAEYFEVGRTELIRSLGLPYKKMEEEGVMLPVSELNIRYYKAAKYDDLLTIRTSVSEFPTVKLLTEYEIFNENKELLTKGTVLLVFVSIETGRVTKIPPNMKLLFETAWGK